MNDSRHAVEATDTQSQVSRLVGRIEEFCKTVDDWCRIGNEYHTVNNIVVPILATMSQLKSDAHREPRNPDLQTDFEEKAGRAMKQVVPITDQDFSGNPARTRRLNDLVEKLAANAGLRVVTPRIGDKYDEQRHKACRFGAAVGGRRTITGVVTRGLERANGDTVQVLLRAEVEVDT